MIRNRSRVGVAVALGLLGACRPAAPDDPAAAFRATARALAAEAEAAGVTTVTGRDDWLFFAPELRHASLGAFWGPRAGEVSRARREDARDPLPAIVDTARQLEAAGVELLVVPVPPKAVIYPGMISPAMDVSSPPRLDPDHQAFYALLRGEGVEVLDLTDRFLADPEHPEGPAYCRHDTHWSGVGCVIAGREIAAAVRRRPWYDAWPRQRYAARWRDVTINGDLARGLDAARSGERLRLREIGRGDGPRAGRPEPDAGSPVVLLGDSHTLVFHAGGDMHAIGAGLPDQLAYELGFPVDLVAVRGSASTAARVNLLRRAQRDGAYWEGKRLVVWCFAAREFTEGDGWPLIPVRP